MSLFYFYLLTFKNSPLDQKWPNMAGLSTFQCGPKGPTAIKMSTKVFSTIWDPIWPIWTLLEHFKQKLIPSHDWRTPK